MRAILILVLFCLLSRGIFASHDAPVVYGISPFYFSAPNGKNSLNEIKRRLPEIKELGANVIWLQPIYPSAQPGQGYDHMDVFKVNPNFGTEADLKALISEAHKLKMKVILDIALNHLPMEHSFAQDVIKNGAKSTYSDFFQIEINPQHAYSKHAHLLQIENGQFVHYFWKTFFNLNYDSLSVRNYALSALEFWVREFDVDGYRLDAAWGAQNRWPEFYNTVSSSLRKLKPDIFILAEDHVSYPQIYKDHQQPHLKNSGITAAYDWNANDPYYVSKWNFQIEEEDHSTIFNLDNPEEAANLFVEQIQAQENSKQAVIFRYLQNNDLPSFLQHHNLKQTKFAAAAMILLPGVPLIFYGQELGLAYEQWHLPTIDPKLLLKSYDSKLWAYYQKLLSLKQQSIAFREGEIISVRTIAHGKVELVIGTQAKNEKMIFDFKSYKVMLNNKPI